MKPDCVPEIRINGTKDIVKYSDGDCKLSYTAIIEQEGSDYVALCPKLDVASQGATVEEAAKNLK